MSYYIDPWLYNCAEPTRPTRRSEQAEQRMIIEATQRALRYAHDHGVTLIAAAGNQDDDLGDPEPDGRSSPDYPAGDAAPADVDDACLSHANRGRERACRISALGPSKRKSYYSNYGISGGWILSAPGGDARDSATRARRTRPTGSSRRTPRRRWPGGVTARRPPCARSTRTARRDSTLIQSTGTRTCTGAGLQGTSMASPHAVGVAALIVSEYGTPRPAGTAGLTLNPRKTEQILRRYGDRHRRAPSRGCSTTRSPRAVTQYTAFCDGPPSDNGFYGDGIVNALAAVEQGQALTAWGQTP